MFAANARQWWEAQIRAGDVVRWPYLSVPTAPIDERDMQLRSARCLKTDTRLARGSLPSSIAQAGLPVPRI